MKLGLTLLVAILAASLFTPVHAQVLKPLDLTKQADVNNKTVTFGEVPVRFAFAADERSAQ